MIINEPVQWENIYAKESTIERKIEEAAVLGRNAYKEGRKCIPHQDKYLDKLLEGIKVGEGIEIIKKWHQSWVEANLSYDKKVKIINKIEKIQRTKKLNKPLVGNSRMLSKEPQVAEEKNMEKAKTVNTGNELSKNEKSSLDMFKEKLEELSFDELHHKFGDMVLKQQELIKEYKEAIIENNDKYKVIGDEKMPPDLKKNAEEQLSKEAFKTYAKNHPEFRAEFVVVKEKYQLEELKDQLKTMTPDKVAELFEEKRIAQNKIVDGFKENIKEYYPDKSDKELNKIAFAKYCNNQKYESFRTEFVEVMNKHKQHVNTQNLEQLKTDLKGMNIDQVKYKLEGRIEIQDKIIDKYKENIKNWNEKGGKEITEEAIGKQAFAKYMNEPKYDQLKSEYKAISGRLKELEKTEEKAVEKPEKEPAREK